MRCVCGGEHAGLARVIGRRNHFGSKSARGTVVAATMHSLVESAKAAGLDPIAYLVVGRDLREAESGRRPPARRFQDCGVMPACTSSGAESRRAPARRYG